MVSWNVSVAPSGRRVLIGIRCRHAVSGPAPLTWTASEPAPIADRLTVAVMVSLMVSSSAA